MTDEKVSDGWGYRTRDERGRESIKRRSNDNSGRYASDYQPVSDALETDNEEEWTRAWQEERQRERGRLRACELGSKDDWREKRIIRGGARGEVNQEGQWVYMPKYDFGGVRNPATGALTNSTWHTVVSQCLSSEAWVAWTHITSNWIASFLIILMQYHFRARLCVQERLTIPINYIVFSELVH